MPIKYFPGLESYCVSPIVFNTRRLQNYKSGVNGLLTFLSGDSIIFHSLSFSWCSSSNFMLTSSIESCSKSQKPARSWEVGLGMALGSCSAQRKGCEYSRRLSVACTEAEGQGARFHCCSTAQRQGSACSAAGSCDWKAVPPTQPKHE